MSRVVKLIWNRRRAIKSVKICNKQNYICTMMGFLLLLEWERIGIAGKVPSRLILSLPINLMLAILLRKHTLAQTGNPYWRRRISTVALLVLTSSDQLFFRNYIFLTTYLNEKVNRTEPSPSVRVPWLIYLAGYNINDVWAESSTLSLTVLLVAIQVPYK